MKCTNLTLTPSENETETSQYFLRGQQTLITIPNKNFPRKEDYRLMNRNKNPKQNINKFNPVI